MFRLGRLILNNKLLYQMQNLLTNLHLAYKFVNICSIVCTWLPNILLFATYFAADVHIDYSRHLLRLTCKFVKSLARCSREELQSSMKSQLTQPAAQDSEERVLHPVHGGQSPIRPGNTFCKGVPMSSSVACPSGNEPA